MEGPSRQQVGVSGGFRQFHLVRVRRTGQDKSLKKKKQITDVNDVTCGIAVHENGGGKALINGFLWICLLEQ